MLYELKEIRKAKGLSQKEAAEELDVPLGTYRNWEQLLSMPRDNKTLLKVARYYKVSVEELFGYDLVEPGSFSSAYDNDPEESTVNVPRFGRIAAGIPLEMDAVEDHIQVPKELFRKFPKAFFLTVEGESMNRILPNGSYALIDPSKKDEDVISGKIYAVCINGYDATIKRVKKLANGFELVPLSTDPTYKPEVFDNDDPRADDEKKVTIIGEVVWFTVPHDYIEYAVVSF